MRPKGEGRAQLFALGSVATSVSEWIRFHSLALAATRAAAERVLVLMVVAKRYNPWVSTSQIKEAMAAAPSSSSRRFTLSRVSVAAWW